MNTTLNEPLVVCDEDEQCVGTSNGMSDDNEFDERSVGVRRLSPIECERLQGFPDNWTEGESQSARYRMLGNAVAVPVVAWIAKRLVEVDERIESGSSRENDPRDTERNQ